jgi:hypothetical protein
MSLTEWYRLLNERVFFWVREERLQRLLNARAYREEAHTIIVVNAGELVGAHAGDIKLSPINSGSTAYVAVPRGRATFKTIPDYPYDARRKIAGRDAVVELSVKGGVPDIRDYTVRVERWRGDRRLRTVWRR